MRSAGAKLIYRHATLSEIIISLLATLTCIGGAFAHSLRALIDFNAAELIKLCDAPLSSNAAIGDA